MAASISFTLFSACLNLVSSSLILALIEILNEVSFAMMFRQLLVVLTAMAIFFPFVLGGEALKFVATWIIAPTIVLLLGGLAVALFVAFLVPPRS